MKHAANLNKKVDFSDGRVTQDIVRTALPMLAAQIIMFLPYARTEETAKNHTVYRKMSLKASIILFIEGILPMIPLFWTAGLETALIFVPCLVMYFLFYQMNRKIHGYTGDCCGALFLLIELSFYLTMTIL